MAGKRIDSIIVKEAIEKELQYLSSNLEEISGKIKSMGAIRVKMEGAGTVKDLSKAQTELSLTMREFEKVLGDRSKAQARLNALESESAKLMTAEKLALQERNKALRDSVKLDQSKEGSIDQLRVKLRAAQQEYDALSKAEREAAAGGQLLNKIKALDTELKQLEGSTGRYQRQVGNYKIVVDGLTPEIQKMITAYERAAVRVTQLEQSMGKAHPAAIAARQEFEGLRKPLENMGAQFEKVTGRTDRAAQAQFSLQQVLRETPSLANGVNVYFSAISNNLPILAENFKLLRSEMGSGKEAFKAMLGSVFSFQTGLLAGLTILTVYGKDIANWVTGLIKGAQAMDAIKQKQTILNTTMVEANGEYTKAVTLVGDLRNKLQLAKEGLIDKEKTLKFYNETIGVTTGEVKSLNEAEQALAKNADAYVKFTLYKAAAQAAFNESAKLAVQLQMEQQDPNSRRLAVVLRATDAEAKYGKKIRESAEYQKLQREEGDAFSRTISDRTAENIAAYEKLKGSAQAYYEEQLALLSGGVKAQNAKTLEEIGKDYEKKAAELSAKFKFNFYQKTDEKKQDNSAEDKAERERKAQSALRILALERLKAEQEAVMNMENYTASFRIKAATNVAAIQKQIIEEAATTELENTKLTADQRKLIEEKKADDLAKIDQELSVRRLTIAKSERENMAEIISQGAADFEKEQQARFEAKLQADEEELNQRILQAQITRDQEIKLANENYQAKAEAAKGNAEEEAKLLQDLNKRKEEIDLAYQRTVLQNQIIFLKKRIELFRAEGKDVKELEAAVARAEAELSNYINSSVDKQTEKLGKLISALEIASNKFKDFSSFVSGMSQALATREKNQIQDQIDQIEKRKQAEIERINASADSEERKAARVKLIEARAATDRERLERKKREEDIKTAKLQKALTIMQIILTNALNVAKAVGSGNPAKVIYAIAMGAAQLAVAIATPIPAYAKGKGPTDSYEGPAMVGEAGREIGVSREGKVTMYDRPTLTYLRKGDVIHPNRVTEDMIRAAHIDRIQLIQQAGGNENTATGKLEEKTDKVIDQLRQLNKKPAILIQNNPAVESTAWYMQHLKH